MSTAPGPFAVLVNNGFRYDYYMTLEARSAYAARQAFKKTGDWRANDFRVRDDRPTLNQPTKETSK